MKQDWKMQIYWHLPVFLQEIALSLYGGYLDRLYYGEGYEEWRQYFESWQKFSLQDGVEWQSQCLQRLLNLAATRVPFYQESFRSVNWKGVRYPKDLIELPLLKKQDIRQNEHRFLVEGLNPKALWVEKTSGTTGTSLKIYWPMAMVPQWYALFETTVRNVAGVGKNIPRAMMGRKAYY